MADIIKWLKRTYEKYFKLHCQNCGGVCDAEMLDMVLDRMMYKCRDCGEEWI